MEPAPTDRIILPTLGQSAKAAPTALRDGQILRLQVKSAGNGVVKLAGGGVTLTAGDLARLTKGETLTVRVRLSRGTVQLEILQRSDPGSGDRFANSTLFSRFLTEHRLVDSEASQDVFRGFLASFRVLLPDLFRRTMAQLRLVPKRNRAVARGVLELTDREISLEQLDPNHVSALLGWFSGEFGGGNGWDWNGGEPAPGDAHTPDVTALKTFLHRVAVNATHPIQLYNALLPATTDLHWVVFPIRASAGSRSLSSVLKVCWDVRKARPKEAVLSIERENGRWWFRWEIDRVSRLVAAGAEGATPGPPETLLAILGGTRHTEIDVSSDGFSLESQIVGDGSVDHYG